MDWMFVFSKNSHGEALTSTVKVSGGGDNWSLRVDPSLMGLVHLKSLCVPREDTATRHWSANQKKGPHQESNQLATWPWTSQPLEREK